MYDQPKASVRTRVTLLVSISLILMQGVLVSAFEMTDTLRQVSLALTVVSLAVALAMMLWACTQVRGALAPKRNSAIIAIAGATIRAAALAPLILQDARLTGGLLSSSAMTWLTIGYALLFAGFIMMVADTAHESPILLPAAISIGCAIAVFGAFCFATFGPVPGMPTEFTPRDRLALGLLTADVSLAALATTIALASLSRQKGVLTRPWLWVATGVVLAAMGDSVQPLLSLEDTALYTGLLWVFGYALIAYGASFLIDVIRWSESGPQARASLLYRPAAAPADAGAAHSWGTSAIDTPANVE